MLKPFGYFFYRIYVWQLKWWGKDNGPEQSALMGVSLLVFANLYTLATIVSWATGFNVLKATGSIAIQALIVAIALAAIGEVLFVRGGRYEEIVKQFEKESKPVRIRNSIFCLLYVIATVTLTFGSRFWFPLN
jgi:hypothetical protein